MAYGSELFLGVQGVKEIGAILSSLNLSVDKNGEFSYSDKNYKKLERINKSLVAPWKDAITELGYKILDPATIKLQYKNGRPFIPYKGHFCLDTEFGIRETTPWNLEYCYDPHEMDESLEDAVLGISLISRYFPTFLDIKNEHGGSGDIMHLNKDVLTKIEIARKHLVKHLPFVTDADIIIKEKFY